MDINSIRTKYNFHKYITLKQKDNTSDIELVLCNSNGQKFTELNSNCTITLLDIVDRVVRARILNVPIRNGEVSFKVTQHLKSNRHNLEITLDDGRKFPSDGDFTVNVRSTHDNVELNLVQSISKEQIIEKISNDVKASVTTVATDYLRNNAILFKGEVGPRGEIGLTGKQGIQGPQGVQGDPFTYDDFTEEQLALLKGPKGDKGDKGDRGEAGPKGDKGEKGDKGDVGPIGPIGPQGVKGDKGEQGERGLQGPQGVKGDKGDDLKIDGVVPSIEQLPEGTTASNYIVGDDLYFRVAGQSKWQKGLTLKNEVTIKDGFFYIDGKKTTAAANESVVKKYVDSLEIGVRNLLAVSKAEADTVLIWTSGLPNREVGSFTSGYIPCEKNDTFVSSVATAQLFYFDEDKELLTVGGNKAGGRIFTIHNDDRIKYLRVAYRDNVLNGKPLKDLRIMLAKGNKPTQWTPALEDLLPKKQSLVLQNGFTGTVTAIKDGNNLVTVKFDLTTGSTIAGGTSIAVLPSSWEPDESFIPIAATNLTMGTPDFYFNIANSTRSLRVAKTLTPTQRYVGQVTYRQEV